MAFILFSAGQNLVFLHFYDGDRHPLDCKKTNETVHEEINNIGGFFIFRHFNLKQSNSEANNKNFEELVLFLKSKCMEGSTF